MPLKKMGVSDIGDSAIKNTLTVTVAALVPFLK